jgi:hypothetical protein
LSSGFLQISRIDGKISSGGARRQGTPVQKIRLYTGNFDFFRSRGSLKINFLPGVSNDSIFSAERKDDGGCGREP